jgi:hypothetical protein
MNGEVMKSPSVVLPPYIGTPGALPKPISESQNRSMPMRTECRHYESRTYAEGEVVRKCRLDLAPEAPWRCPDGCACFEVRRMDAGWNYGSLKSAGKSPGAEPEGENVGALLDAAEDIVNAAAPDILSEFKTEKPPKRRKRGWKRR